MSIRDVVQTELDTFALLSILESLFKLDESDISRNDLIDSSSTVLLLCSTRQRERDCGERPAARRRFSIRDLQQLIAPFSFHLPICLIG